MKEQSSRSARWLAVSVAGFIHPIFWPAWAIEKPVRLRTPAWQFDPYTATPYFLLLTLAATLGLVSKSAVPVLVGAYMLTAMEVLCLWLSVAVAIGDRSTVPTLLSEFGRRQPRRDTDTARILLSPPGLYVATFSDLFTIYYFAAVAFTLYAVDPGAYRGVEVSGAWPLLWSFVYHSVVTISTLGFGDIVPKTIPAQVLTVLEVILGLFFTVFLFGAFVSYHVAALSPKR